MGGIFGFKTNCLYFPEDEIYVAILSNNTSIDPSNVSNLISAYLLGEAVKKYVNIDIEDLEDYTGTYKVDEIILEIANDTNGLSLTAPWFQGKLLAINLNEFHIKGESVSCTFNRDSSGVIESMTAKHRFFGDEWFTAKQLIE